MTRKKTSGSASAEELAALLKDTKTSAAAIAEELSVAGHDAITAAHIDVARAALAGASDVAALATLPPELAGVVLRAAGEAGNQELLRQIATEGGKDLAKDAKRELQRLRSRGVEVAELAPTGVSIVKPLPALADPPCYASSLDGFGERALWIAKNVPGRGIHIAQLVVSDVRGVVAVDVLGLGRRAWREFRDSLPHGGPVFTAEISREHARWLVQQATQVNDALRLPAPHELGQAAPLLGPLPPAGWEPPSRTRFPRENDKPGDAARSAELFDSPLFASWIPAEETLRALSHKVEEISVSRLYVDEAQRRAAVHSTLADAAAAYWTAERRVLYAARLLEMAFVIAEAGQGDLAALAAATSHALDSDAPLESVPFALRLFDRAFQLPAEPPPAAPESAGLIVP